MGRAVLVHGAWHGAWCWDGVLAELEQFGVPTIAVELPLTGFGDDVAVARAVIESAGSGTVVVGHSYGGAVISEAAAGLSTVSHLVYLAAFLVEPGEDLFALLAGSGLIEALIVDEHGIRVDPSIAAELFYGDADPVTAATLVARLRPMAMGIGRPQGRSRHGG